jgi:hypothetical protein
MVKPDFPAVDESFAVQRLSAPGSIILGRETNRSDDISIDGAALASFLTHLDEARIDMQVVSEALPGDEDFQMGDTVTGMDEIGALLIGGSAGVTNARTHNHTTGVFLLPRGTARFVCVSSFDIQSARQIGDVVGWIHSQPGNTDPSIGVHGDAADVNVSRFLARQCQIPIHLALITNRDGSGLTAYLYDDTATEPEKRFKKMPGLKIDTPPDLSLQQINRLKGLRYI